MLAVILVPRIINLRHSTRHPSDLLGTWRVTKYVKADGSQKMPKEIGCFETYTFDDYDHGSFRAYAKKGMFTEEKGGNDFRFSYSQIKGQLLIGNLLGVNCSGDNNINYDLHLMTYRVKRDGDLLVLTYISSMIIRASERQETKRPFVEMWLKRE